MPTQQPQQPQHIAQNTDSERTYAGEDEGSAGEGRQVSLRLSRC